jgi:hypothetical protein
VYCLVWAIVHWLAYPNLDSYHDMLENFAWAQTFEWGTFKHPPLFVWVVDLWFSAMPRTALAYKLLSYLNVAVGLWGVARLAKLLGLSNLATPAVLLLLWTLPYTTLAAKFNANAILLSVWPWTAVAWLASLRQSGRAGIMASLWLGLLGAVCMLSKYYSGVFLLALFLAALLRRDMRSWFTSAKPYIALLTLALFMVPHGLWAWQHDFPTLHYAMEQGGGKIEWRALLHFALTPLTFSMLAWPACVGVFAVQQGRVGGSAKGWWVSLRRVPHLALISWRPLSWHDTLFWLAILPGAITLIAGLAGVAELSSPWAIPTIFALPLLWLRNLNVATSQPPMTAGTANLLQPTARRSVEVLTSAAWPVLLIVVIGGLGLAVEQAQRSRKSYYEATEQAATAMMAGWQQRHPRLKLGWTGGEWAENAMIAFYVSAQVRALPGMPDEWPATLAPHPTWDKEGGMLICPRGALLGPDVHEVSNCEIESREWIERTGRPVEAHWVVASRSGWRFPRPVEFAYVVFDYAP